MVTRRVVIADGADDAAPGHASAVAAALRLRERVFVEEQGVPLALEHDAWDAMAQHVVILSGAAAVATGRVRLVAPGVAKIERVAVAADHRRSGLGRQIMDLLEAEARALGAGRARLSAQETAVAFYRELGYAPFGERFMEAGLPHVWMERPLGP